MHKFLSPSTHKKLIETAKRSIERSTEKKKAYPHRSRPISTNATINLQTSGLGELYEQQILKERELETVKQQLKKKDEQLKELRRVIRDKQVEVEISKKADELYSTNETLKREKQQVEIMNHCLNKKMEILKQESLDIMNLNARLRTLISVVAQKIQAIQLDFRTDCKSIEEYLPEDHAMQFIDIRDRIAHRHSQITASIISAMKKIRAQTDQYCRGKTPNKNKLLVKQLL